MTSEKTSVTWISDMIALVYKKELMWDALELVLDNLSCSSFWDPNVRSYKLFFLAQFCKHAWHSSFCE